MPDEAIEQIIRPNAQNLLLPLLPYASEEEM